ncbi:hypothetical protein Vau01_011580 [Virgisporangium aurantiacum]|uniref:Uncharacterized protein n=1 Tax=Virgisporangium aurantiacum TaxID=175570 RepID=A0A8J3YZL3_9ACTN|nr:hypothetical protein Vau01_011580 [Virgisporangium aurantiacum]
MCIGRGLARIHRPGSSARITEPVHRYLEGRVRAMPPTVRQAIHRSLNGRDTRAVRGGLPDPGRSRPP